MLTAHQRYVLQGIADHNFTAFIIAGYELIDGNYGGATLRNLEARGFLARFMDTINEGERLIVVDVFDITETGRAALKDKE